MREVSGNQAEDKQEEKKMKLTKWNDMEEKTKKQVLSRYVLRHHAIGEGKYYKDENAWCEDHAFYVTKSGRLSLSHRHCEPHYLADNSKIGA